MIRALWFKSRVQKQHQKEGKRATQQLVSGLKKASSKEEMKSFITSVLKTKCPNWLLYRCPISYWNDVHFGKRICLQALHDLDCCRCIAVSAILHLCIIQARFDFSCVLCLFYFSLSGVPQEGYSHQSHVKFSFFRFSLTLSVQNCSDVLNRDNHGYPCWLIQTQRNYLQTLFDPRCDIIPLSSYWVL